MQKEARDGKERGELSFQGGLERGLRF